MICYLYINELIDFHSLRSDHMPNEAMQFLSKRILLQIVLDHMNMIQKLVTIFILALLSICSQEGV